MPAAAPTDAAGLWPAGPIALDPPAAAAPRYRRLLPRSRRHAGVVGLAAGPGATASPGPEPGKDPCLVGTWSQVRMEKQNEVDGRKHPFIGGAGDIRTFSADGRFTEDFTPAAPITAVVNGVTWQETTTGNASGTYQARNGVLLYTDTAATGTWTFTRNGRRNNSGPLSFSVEPEQYICTGGALTIAASFYTSSWTRVGASPS